MTLKINAFDSNTFTYKIIQQDDTVATANIDVTQGVAGSLQSIEISNGHTSAAVLKITLTETAPVVGTTVPDIMIALPGEGTTNLEMPDGIPFTTLSFWATTSEADDGAASPTGAGNTNASDTTIITLVTS